MKKFATILALSVMVLSCKSTSATSTKSNNKAEVMIKGDWTITSVSYPGSDYIRVISFGIADAKCFEGSSWHFISNNNKGTMALSQTGCADFSSPITWFVNDQNQFVLKVLSAGEKAKKVRDGYALTLANQTESAFQLLDKIDVGGKMTNVIYQFQKK